MGVLECLHLYCVCSYLQFVAGGLICSGLLWPKLGLLFIPCLLLRCKFVAELA